MNTTNPTLTAIAALLPMLPDAEMRQRLEMALTAPEENPAVIQDRVLSAKETARVFSVVPKTIHRMAAEGTLHRVKLPGRIRGVGFLQSEVGALLARCAGIQSHPS